MCRQLVKPTTTELLGELLPECSAGTDYCPGSEQRLAEKAVRVHETNHEYEHNSKRKSMNKNNSIVAIYPSHTAAEAAIKELQQSGFDMKKLSIVGRDEHTDEHVVGYYNAGTA